MKLHNYLDQLLGSKSSISVLRTLMQHKGKIFTIRRLAREASVSHPQVSDTVTKLERLGVVQVQPIGRSHQVTLNEEIYVLKDIVEPMFMAEEQTYNQMIHFLKNYLSTKKSLEPQFLEVLQEAKKKRTVTLMLSSYPTILTVP